MHAILRSEDAPALVGSGRVLPLAALRSIVRPDTGESYDEFLERLAKASGIETPTREDLSRQAAVSSEHPSVLNSRTDKAIRRNLPAKGGLEPCTMI